MKRCCFGDAVHPTHAVRPVGCWAPKDTPVSVEQTSGRQRLNIHGAIDLEAGQTRMIEAATVNAISMIMLLREIEAMYPGLAKIELFSRGGREGWTHWGLEATGEEPSPTSLGA